MSAAPLSVLYSTAAEYSGQLHDACIVQAVSSGITGAVEEQAPS